MAKVAVVSDSTANIPMDLTQGLPITTIPLNLIWGEKTFLDSIDITPDEFYTRLKSAKVMPTTSQPSPEAFRQVFEKLHEQGMDILAITISSNLSGTMDSATQAKWMLPGANISLVDSLQSGMGLGFPVLLAARAARDGASLEECTRIAQETSSKMKLYLGVSTLEYLHRGGRIGGGAAFFGTALNLKPILALQNGRIEAYKKIRTMKKVLEQLSEIVVSQVEKGAPVRVATMHAQAEAEAASLLEVITQKLGKEVIVEALCTEVSPVIGTHTGPGTVGVSFFSA